MSLRTGGFAKVIGVVIAIFIAYIAWSNVRERVAKDNARTFCERFQVGTLMIDVAEAASVEGDKMHRIVKDDHIAVAYIGTFPFSRHICFIDGSGGKVVKARVSHLD